MTDIRHAIARIIAPRDWAERERLLTRSAEWQERAVNDAQRHLAARYATDAEKIVTHSLELARQIIPLIEAGVREECAAQVDAHAVIIKNRPLEKGVAANACAFTFEEVAELFSIQAAAIRAGKGES